MKQDVGEVGGRFFVEDQPRFSDDLGRHLNALRTSTHTYTGNQSPRVICGANVVKGAKATMTPTNVPGVITPNPATDDTCNAFMRDES
jgi:hypothetical protein